MRAFHKDDVTPRITVLTTGGTIASRERGPMVPGGELAFEIQEFFPGVEISVFEVFRKGSSQITSDTLWELGVQVNRAFSNGASGVVVTHGTDTLEESAYFLDLVCGGLGPIVVTGAMRGRDAIAPEGVANLVESCKVALEPSSSTYGVLVVMNDQIHLARDVTKVHSWLLHAFESPGFGPVGFVGPEGVRFMAKPLYSAVDREAYSHSFEPPKGLVTPVDLLKATLDSGDRLIKASVETGARGIVVESLGYGHLPPGVYEACLEAVETGVPVVVTTRCVSGGAKIPERYRIGSQGRSNHGLIATDLNGPKARIKLMLALSITNNPVRLAEIFSAHGMNYV